mgnify:CR=1 FL=1
MESENVKYNWSEDFAEEAKKVVSQDCSSLSSFTYNKFEREASKMWNLFYKHNSTNFFKDRHYLLREFSELHNVSSLREVGCGVGNAIFPLLRTNFSVKIQACDFSSQAISLLRSHPEFSEDRITTDVCDIAQAPPKFQEVDCVTMLFVISAIAPELQRQAVLNATSGLKAGGVVLFRDYARYDEAQVRLAKKGGKKLKDNFYLKQDGTRVYYFLKEEVTQLFEGFECQEINYCYREIQNRKEQQVMHRVWIQANFRVN